MQGHTQPLILLVGVIITLIFSKGPGLLQTNSLSVVMLFCCEECSWTEQSHIRTLCEHTRMFAAAVFMGGRDQTQSEGETGITHNSKL